jgi:chorismate mutase
MSVRGIRGAITVTSNSSPEIIAATKELLSRMVAENSVEVEDIASIIFSVTRDLNAEFPAVAARELGWEDAPLLCTFEIDVPGSLAKCIRVLLHVNCEKKQAEIKHIYLKEASKLRRGGKR